MAIVIGNTSISGINAGGLPSASVQLADFAAGTFAHTYNFTIKQTMSTGITDSNTTTLRQYSTSGWSLPSNTTALVVRVYYLHGGGANHGYFSSNLYQTGYSTNYATYESSHFDWYYNSTNEFLYVPWEPSGTAQLNLECTASYNTGGSNQYNFYLEGVICGTNV